MAVACGGSSAEHALPPEAAHAPHVDDDGWTRWELGARWPAAPTRTSAPLPHASEALADLLAMREANTLRGVPDPRGATLHDVELTERLPSAPERTVTRRLLVVPESVAGVRFAIDGALLVPLTGIGPEHDLFRDCDRALDRLEEGGPLVDAEHLCPLRSAWLVLLDRGREDLVLRWLANPNARSAEGFAAGDRASELGRRAAAHFAHGDDGAAIADLEARAEVERIGTVVAGGVVTRFSQRRAEVDDEDATWMLSEARRRLDPREPPANEIDGLIRDLENVAPALDGAESMAESRQVRAIVARGESMVPALLAALDDRETATRTVIERGDRERLCPRPRYDAVWIALGAVLEHHAGLDTLFSDYPSDSWDGLDAHVFEIRDYWARYGSMTPPERRWAVLSDDDARVEEWAQAARWITSDALVSGADLHGFEPPRELTGGPLRGEALRERAEPSVSDLIAERLGSQPDQTLAGAEVSNLVLAAGRWDAAGFASRGPLLARVARVAPGNSLPFIAATWGDDVPAVRRVLLVDRTDELLGGLAEPSLLAAAQRWIAGDEAGLEAARAYYRVRGEDALIARMSTARAALTLARGGIAPARTWLIAELEDVDVVGRLETSNGNATFVGTDMTIDLDLQPPSAPVEVRERDMIAYALRESLVVPVQLAWPVVQRDQAIEELAATLAP